uniref:Secreted protein n=1 Tax=Macrostomum lignano TaxID=282301 RepID=A0A1I8IJ34_9PLAT
MRFQLPAAAFALPATASASSTAASAASGSSEAASCMWPRQVARCTLFNACSRSASRLSIRFWRGMPRAAFRCTGQPGPAPLIAWPVFCAWKLRLVARTTAAQPPSSGDAERL